VRNLLAPVASAYLRLALCVPRAALLLLLHHVELGAQHLHRHGAVLDLRLLLLALHHHAGGLCVSRTAESVVFTLCPPEPVERMTSILDVGGTDLDVALPPAFGHDR